MKEKILFNKIEKGSQRIVNKWSTAKICCRSFSLRLQYWRQLPFAVSNCEGCDLRLAHVLKTYSIFQIFKNYWRSNSLKGSSTFILGSLMDFMIENFPRYFYFLQELKTYPVLHIPCIPIVLWECLPLKSMVYHNNPWASAFPME